MKNIFTLFVIFLNSYTFGQNNYLDQNFGNAGKANGARQTSSSQIQNIIQPDGKILQNATVYNDQGSFAGFGLIRYKANGTMDSSFGINAYAYTPFGQYFGAVAQTLALQLDNKILVGGYSTSDIDFISDATLVRYNTDGTIDNSFNGNGKVLTRTTGINTSIYNLKIQPDGKIVVAGSYYTYAEQIVRSILLRYNSDGTLDNSFGTSGKIFIVVGSGADDINHLALQSDGKIVVTGSAIISGHTQFVTLRFNSDGTPDANFGISGQIITNLGSQSNDATSLLIQADGKIVIAGNSTYTGGIPQLAILRYNSDGTSDNTFNPTTFTSGYLLKSGGNVGGSIYSILQQLGGKLLFGGTLINRSPTTQITSSDFFVFRLNINGSADNIFDTNGNSTSIVIVDLGNTDSGGFIQFQGTNIIIGGGTSYFAPGSSFESTQTGVARIINSAGAVLPVQLQYFTVQKQGENATLVQWKTSSEINSHYFNVERSSDAINFFNIGKLNAAGNSSREISYSFTDNQPLKGVNYYRLKQVDLDAHIIFSSSRLVRFDEVNKLRYYPNPTHGILNIEITQQMQQEAMVISISNVNGIILDEIRLQSNLSNILSVNMNKYPIGTYFIQLKTNTTNNTQRVVLQ